MSVVNNPFANQNSNTPINTILVEKHYIPVNIYMQMYNHISQYTNAGNNIHNNHMSYRMPYANSHHSHMPNGRQNVTRPTVAQNDFVHDDMLHNNMSYNTDLFAMANTRLYSHDNHEPISTGIITETDRTNTGGNNSNSTPSIFNMLMNTLLNSSDIHVTEYSDNQRRISPVQLDANSRIITYSSNIDLGSPTCTICTQEWQHGEELRKLNVCRHYFHKPCIDTWLRDHNTCPLCRANIIRTPDGINDVD